MSRRRRRPWPVALAAPMAVVLVAAACGGSGGSALPTTTLRVVDPFEMVVIENRLVKDVPDGFLLADDADSDTGPTDLLKAVRDQGGTPEVRQFFVDNGFTVGFQRSWTSTTAAELLVFLYQFGSSDGARAQARSIEDSIRGNAGPTGIRSFSPGIPGAVGLENPDVAAPVVAVVFAKGPYWSLVRLSGRDGEALRRAVVDVAKNQYDRLP